MTRAKLKLKACRQFDFANDEAENSREEFVTS
jgi:hypothetical protein